MARLGFFIRRRGEECSIVKVLPNGGEEILEHGLTLIEAETLYFVCIGEPVWHETWAMVGTVTINALARDVCQPTSGSGRCC